ncbi:glycosyltransferase family 4 protein [Limnofasciculus baicalensis]|uniref:Glycosyltransferase family 4 protein n=1 Tax=Limnofasciculus baicalensis BBK-W-15 TaxID=2699891 RepID=A0AAE3GQ09_9CYAN|nr:glycosyltransferase family 4 protein [Limnofasciculus baicalensis]MCP2728635.1 glycosyltransferase family 4 protein [Limnofasciculus baicalensis BBK-W-15]
MNQKSGKIKVGFYLRNEGYPNADVRFPELGNPGIGGTQFTTIATAYYLNKFYSDRVEVLILANSTKLLPPSLKTAMAANEVDAAVKSKEAGCDIFVFKSQGNEELFKQLHTLNINAIARSNNTPKVHVLNQLADIPQIKCHLCVGQEQLDSLRDHKIFDKSTRIFNPFNADNFVPKNDIVKTGNTVVFLGSIIPAKGFHFLARVWREILKQKPEARLIVIGTGQVYSRNNKLGKWGVAEENYEANSIRPFLSDENGNVIESVHFAGLLGTEKIEILQKADVGVVNPSGATETFCSGAVEIQACGTPVVSAAKGGLLDTVSHGKTGLLGNSDRELVKNILYLLNNPTIAKEFGKNGIEFVKNKFSYQENAKQWLELLTDICNDKLPRQPPMKSNYFYDAKFLREGMRVLKKTIPPLRSIPSLSEIKALLKGGKGE